MISFFNSNLDENGSRYTILYKIVHNVNRFLFSVIALFYLTNISFWLVLPLVFFIFIEILTYSVVDESLLDTLTEYGYVKNIQNDKTKNLTKNYEELIN